VKKKRSASEPKKKSIIKYIISKNKTRYLQTVSGESKKKKPIKWRSTPGDIISPTAWEGQGVPLTGRQTGPEGGLFRTVEKKEG